MVALAPAPSGRFSFARGATPRAVADAAVVRVSTMGTAKDVDVEGATSPADPLQEDTAGWRAFPSLVVVCEIFVIVEQDALFVDSTAALHSTSGLVGSMYPGSSAHVEDDGGGASVKGPFAVLALLAASCVALTTDAAPCADGSPHSLKWDVDWGSSRWRRRPQSPSSPSMVEKVAAAASTSGLAFTASPRRPGSAPQRAGGATI
mmetsp:Transcript_6659/g.20140  ORF Transcript_6659/g.20140 Transcript_6659/m.20140 type:complete len:205 (-) Transcript_6659:1547-2161(-)